MEEEEVEELEECETEENWKNLRRARQGVYNQSTRGAFGVSHFLLCFLLKGKPTNCTKTNKHHWVGVAGRDC